MTTSHRLRSLFRVVLPVVVAFLLVFLAIYNIALVKTFTGESDDGVLWQQAGANVVAREVTAESAGARAGIRPGDMLVTADGQEIQTPFEITKVFHATPPGKTLRYVIARQSEPVPLTVELERTPLVRRGLYYSMAMVGILAIVVGASVRLRRPADR